MYIIYIKLESRQQGMLARPLIYMPVVLQQREVLLEWLEVYWGGSQVQEPASSGENEVKEAPASRRGSQTTQVSFGPNSYYM